MAHQPEYPVHPAADLFPMLGQAELAALGEDIARSGQRFPIQLWAGTLVDGRNRLAACRLVGIAPTVDEVDFNSEAECVRFIISNNIHRRHLTESQRSIIAKDLANLQHGGDRSKPSNEGLTQAQAAELMNVSVASVERAAYVQKHAPDLAPKVKSGELKVSKAASMARERTKPAASRVQPDPDRAADSIQDIQDEMDADGATPFARDILARLAKCSATEKTWLRSEVLCMFGVREG